jgi:phosphoribosylformylglycinamidine synthase
LLGATVELAGAGRPDVLLFNESQSRIVISVSAANSEAVQSQLASAGIPFAALGTVATKELRIRAADQDYRWPIEQLHDGWFNAIARAVGDDSLSDATATV